MSKHDIELIFFDLLRGNLKISEFEKWIYDIDEELIDKHFGHGFYFELVSLNYRSKYVINELEKLLYSKVPFGRFEEIKLREILDSIIEDKGNLAELIEELYDLYCDGYTFLRYLGLAYVFHGMPRENETYSFSKKDRINLKRESRRILSFIDTKRIVITGEFEYDDFREEDEKVELHSLEKMYKRNIIRRILDKVSRTVR